MNANNNKSRRNRRNGNRNQGQAMEMLTGGTRDVKPQLLSFSATQSAADTTTSTTVALPVLRNFSSGNGNRAQLIEILKAYIRIPPIAEVDSSLQVVISTKNQGTTATVFSEPSVFAFAGNQVALTTSGMFSVDTLRIIDLTDGNGNGILVGTDNIYCQVISGSTGLANAVHVKLLYRVTGAPITEWVGIVQGQQ